MRPGGAALTAALLGAGCTPGFTVEVHNAGAEELVLVALGAGGERREERLPPGGNAALSGALSWYVVAGDRSWSVELPHPGDAYESRSPLGLRFRFQVRDRCVFALAADQRPPVSAPPPQPDGYPLGPSGPCRIPTPKP